MQVELISLQDLDSMRKEILQEIERLRSALLCVSSQRLKRWLRGDEVMEMLGISKSTLQNLRESRKIRHTRVSKGVILYDRLHIEEILLNSMVEVV